MTGNDALKASIAPGWEYGADLEEKMRAIKLNAHIDHNHRLEIQLPADVPEGDAEVIVLIPSEVPDEAHRRRHLEAFFASINQHSSNRSREDIDRQIAEERASWGD